MYLMRSYASYDLECTEIFEYVGDDVGGLRRLVSFVSVRVGIRACLLVSKTGRTRQIRGRARSQRDDASPRYQHDMIDSVRL